MTIKQWHRCLFGTSGHQVDFGLDILSRFKIGYHVNVFICDFKFILKFGSKSDSVTRSGKFRVVATVLNNS